MASTISKLWSPSGPNSDVFERHEDFFELARADKSNVDTIPLDPRRSGYSRENVPLDAVFIDQLSAWIKRKKEQVETASEAVRASESSISPKNVYKPITDPYEIRALEIRPGEFNDPLRASLVHCTLEFEYQPIPLGTRSGGDGRHRTTETRYAVSMGLERLVFYTALSYTWGTGGPDATIMCDDEPLSITVSLETALRHFRRRDHTIVMWIDQICINQENNEEKKQQIPLMSRIYSHALNTAIWLGEGLDEPATNNNDDEDDSYTNSDSTTTAFTLLRQIHARFRFDIDTVSTPADLLRLRLPPLTSAAWRRLRTLFALPWFSRLWVIQELILSRSPWMVIGTHSNNANAPDILAMPYNDFSNACYAIVESGLHRLVTPLAGAEMLYNLDGKRLAYSSFQEPPGLFDMLVSTRYAACRFPHDKIYGLLGICRQRGIAIDYDRDAGELYRDVAAMFLGDAVAELARAKEAEYDADLSLHRRAVFDVLICVDHGPRKDMPSWCPDWSRDRVTEALGLATSTASFYMAGGVAEPELVVGAGGRELVLEGKVFDVVGGVSDVFAEPHLGLPAAVGRGNDLLACLELVRRCYPCSGKCACQDQCKYASGCGIFEAFWQTLAAGKDGSGRQKCPLSWSMVFSLLLDYVTGTKYALPDQEYDKRQELPDSCQGKVTVAHLGNWDTHGVQLDNQLNKSLEEQKHTPRSNMQESKEKKKKVKKDISRRGLAEAFKQARKATQHAMRNRRFGITSKKYFGLFPNHVQADDVICVFSGCHVPFLLRRRQENETYQLVGECYVYGIMSGEVMEMEDIRVNSIKLV